MAVFKLMHAQEGTKSSRQVFAKEIDELATQKIVRRVSGLFTKPEQACKSTAKVCTRHGKSF